MDRATLIHILKEAEGKDDVVKPLENLLYVPYARKSRDEEDRQIKSLPDQIAECKDFAKKHSLKLPPESEFIQEPEKASESGIRPKFNQMLENIKQGKYDGILAWHPDRLSRNMKEAGEIIDLIDKGIIKDLKFVSYTFENSVSGKMLLGISFVISKQYSDQLSVNVTRGMKRRLFEGKYLSMPKHGYFKDRNQFLRPDGNNFVIIKDAWKRRIYDNQKLEVIVKYVNEQGYTRPLKGRHQLFKMTKNTLSRILKDQFYTGALRYGDEMVDLTEMYDFTPMITVDEYFKINTISHITKRMKLKHQVRKAGSIKADFLRQMIICGHCGRKTVGGITSKYSTTGKVIKYFYYKCDTNGCSFKNKSVRAKIILEFVYNFLEKHQFTSKGIYEHYLKEMKQVNMAKLKDLDFKHRALTQTALHLQEQIDDIKDFLLRETDPFVKDAYTKDFKLKDKALAEAKQTLEKLKAEKSQNKSLVFTHEKFIELFGNLGFIVRKTTKLEELDYLIKKIFSNFTVKERKVIACSLHLLPIS